MATETSRTRRTRAAKGETTPKNAEPDKGPDKGPEKPEDIGIPSAAPVRRTPTDKKLAASIAGTYQAIGMGLIGLGFRLQDQGLVGTGQATVEQAEGISDAWLKLADQNPAVKKALKKFTEVSAAGTVIGLHVSLLVPILIDRQVIPAPFAAMAGGMATAAASNGNGE